MAILPLRPASKLMYPGGYAQPGINLAHPAANHLVMSAIPVMVQARAGTTPPQDSTEVLNLVTGRKLDIIAAGAGNNSMDIDALIGPAITTVSGGQHLGLSSIPSSVGGPVTVAGIFRYSTNTAGYQTIVVFSGGSRGLWIHNAKPDYYTNVDRDTAFSLTVGESYFLAASIDNTGGATSRLNYVAKNLRNGQVLTDTQGFSASTNTNTSVSVGIDGSNEYSGIPVGPVMYANTFLTMPQLLAWADDPWAFWYP